MQRSRLTGKRGGLNKQAVFVLAILIPVLLIITAFVPRPVRADEPALPAPLCALSNLQVICYDEQTAAPRVLTPPNLRVTDFGIAPDGNWIVYRVNGAVTIAAIYGSATLTVDQSAPPPADLGTTAATLAWSPEGQAIAYVTADGFRIAFPPAHSLPDTLDENDDLYVNLRFSPGGSRLAAQSDSGGWTIFEVNSPGHSLRRLSSIEQSADAAWLDDSNMVIAPTSGGLLRANVVDPKSPPGWRIPDEHFQKLFTTSTGRVLATHPDPGDTIGSTVSISADGTVTELGNAKIDSRVRWGPDGRMMVYIDAGAPILVNRGTGDEDILPIKNVSRLEWSPPPAPLVTSLPLDADLYFLALDSKGVRQLWRLARSGEPATQVTHQPYDVLDYAISPDKTQIALTMGGRLLTVTAANPSLGRLLVLLPYSDPFVGAQPAWSPDGQQIAYISPVYGIMYLIPANGSDKPTPLTPDFSDPAHGSAFFNPQFSPDGRTLLFEAHAAGGKYAAYLLDLKTAHNTVLPVAQGALTWGAGNLLLSSTSSPTAGTTLQLIRVPAVPSAPQIAPQMLPDWVIGGARFASNAPAGSSVVMFLRNIGWSAGPEVVQAYSVTVGDNLATSPPQALGKPGILAGGLLSPTGHYAVSLQRVGTIDQIVMLDVQRGREVRLQGAPGISALRWVP